MPRVFVAVGSNLGDRRQNLATARNALARTAGIRGLKMSPVYETEPVGGPSQGKFLNAVWEIETSLSAREFLKKLLGIEETMGRVRTEKNAPRVIDLDILFYGSEIIEEPGLSVPHPRLHERLFVLTPLKDLAPDWVHPKLNQTVRELWEDVRERDC